MELPSNCFFCCTHLPNENVNYLSNNLSEETISNNIITSSNDSTENTPVIYKEHLYQISQYLQLPKSEIDQYTLPSLTVCQKCQFISEKLSKLCSDLEVTKMKINYYLNLLTDQILTESPNDYDEQYEQSSFQQKFQEKCLTKLSRTNVNPQLILTKCETQPEILENQLTSADDLEDDNQSLTADFQDDNDYDAQEQQIIGQDNPTRKLYDRSSRRCEYCDKMISYTNVSTHKRVVHGIISTGYRPNKPFAYSKLKERVGCEFCGRMVSYRNLSTHKKYYCSVKLNKNNGRNVKVRLAENDKFIDKPDNVKQLLRTCEHCGQVVLRERFHDHESLWCPVTKGKVISLGNGVRNLEDHQNIKMEPEEWSKFV